MPSRRLARLNEQLRREITGILRREVRDPRVRDVVITNVVVTPDLWLARVYVRIAGEGQEREEAVEGLEAASGFIRRELGSMLHIHRIPELRFLEDETLEHATRIEEILREIEQKDDPDHGEGEAHAAGGEPEDAPRTPYEGAPGGGE